MIELNYPSKLFFVICFCPEVPVYTTYIEYKFQSGILRGVIEGSSDRSHGLAASSCQWTGLWVNGIVS